VQSPVCIYDFFESFKQFKSRLIWYRIACLIPVVLITIPVGCSKSDDSVAPAPVVAIDSIPPGEIGPFVPGLTRGDNEFNENGPLVTLEAELGLKSPDSLMCTVYMKAEETEDDWSTAEGKWETLIYKAPDGWKVTGICADPLFCRQQYIDYDDDWDWLFCSTFIFRSQGDTPGEDINNGTEVWIQIRCVEVEIEKE
jgi:hypothetical protein